MTWQPFAQSPESDPEWDALVAKRPDAPEKVARIHAAVARMLEVNPPDVRRFSGHILTCYFFDKPDPGSIDVRCQHCQRPSVLGPKSWKLYIDNPGTFHFVCIICAMCISVLRASQGEHVETHHPDHYEAHKQANRYGL